MLAFWTHRHLRQASRSVLDARRRGVGVYLEEWRLGPAGGDASLAGNDTPPAGNMAQPVLAWCRETLGRTRRPWGVGQFDLALAVSVGQEVRSLSLRRLAPDDLYPGDSLLSELTRFLELERDAAAHLAVALFSWGDAVHATLPAQ